MHISKRMDMRVIVNILPGDPKFCECIRAEGGEHHHSPRLEYPAHFFQSRIRITPGQNEISENEIECCLGKRQSVGIARNRHPVSFRGLRMKR